MSRTVGARASWAKCDMVATVGYARLNLPHSRHLVTGARRYHQIEIDAVRVDLLRRAVAAQSGWSLKLKAYGPI